MSTPVASVVAELKPKGWRELAAEALKASQAVKTLSGAVGIGKDTVKEMVKPVGTMSSNLKKSMQTSKQTGEEMTEMAGKGKKAGQSLEKSMEVVPDKEQKMIDSVIKGGKVTSEATEGMGRQMRWIGRDMMRISNLVGKFTANFTKLWDSAVQGSIALEATMEDLGWAMEDIFAEIGDAVSEAIDPLVDSMDTLADWFEDLPEPLKMLMGVVLIAGAMFGKFAFIIMTLVGFLLLFRYGLGGVAQEAGIATKKMSMFQTLVKTIGLVMKGTLPAYREQKGLMGGLAKVQEKSNALMNMYVNRTDEGKAAIKGITSPTARMFAIQKKLPQLYQLISKDLQEQGMQFHVAGKRIAVVQKTLKKATWGSKIFGGTIGAVRGAVTGFSKAIPKLAGGMLLFSGIAIAMQPLMEAFSPLFEVMGDIMGIVAEMLEPVIEGFVDMMDSVDEASPAMQDMMLSMFGIFAGLLTGNPMLGLFMLTMGDVASATGKAAEGTDIFDILLGSLLDKVVGAAMPIMALTKGLGMNWQMAALLGVGLADLAGDVGAIIEEMTIAADPINVLISAFDDASVTGEQFDEVLRSLGIAPDDFIDDLVRLNVLTPEQARKVRDLTNAGIPLRDALQEVGVEGKDLRTIFKGMEISMRIVEQAFEDANITAAIFQGFLSEAARAADKLGRALSPLKMMLWSLEVAIWAVAVAMIAKAAATLFAVHAHLIFVGAAIAIASIAAMLAVWHGILRLKEGGLVTKTGLAVVHTGEVVVPAAEAAGGGGYGDINITIEKAVIRDERDISSLARDISSRIREESRRAGVFA